MLENLITAALGYGIVFLGLILLMLVVIIIGKSFVASSKKTAAKKEDPAPAESVAQTVPAAPGSAGELKLHNVDPKTAAMLMAIVADKLKKPLNELRFLSIKEVK